MINPKSASTPFDPDIEDSTVERVTDNVQAENASEIDVDIHSPLWEGLTDRDTGLNQVLHPVADHEQDWQSTGGDVDVDEYLAGVVGEEAVGGTTPTPDQNVTEDLAEATGIEIGDRERLHTCEMLEQRDSHRWELEVESSEDYTARNDAF
jgi:Family of unknown function (DUF6335)